MTEQTQQTPPSAENVAQMATELHKAVTQNAALAAQNEALREALQRLYDEQGYSESQTTYDAAMEQARAALAGEPAPHPWTVVRRGEADFIVTNGIDALNYGTLDAAQAEADKRNAGEPAPRGVNEELLDQTALTLDEAGNVLAGKGLNGMAGICHRQADSLRAAKADAHRSTGDG